ncbi:MFS transporter [Saccharothrix sp. HUAS TT1]|uniref:MFS transporter n=1 Tax=unclassified Saccharothrix TaxID=2593673 RepID=UPI00345C4934
MSTARPRRVPAIVAGVVPAIVIGPLNSTMVVVALPDVSRHFGLRPGAESAIVTAYLIAMACLLPVAGKLGDRHGRRRAVLSGLVLFSAASAGAALSGDFALLVGFRVLQAAGGALLLPNGMAILRDVVPPDRLGRTLGVVGVAAPLAAAAGPPLGGLLLSFGDWRALFGVNLVLLLLPVVVGWAVLPRSPRSPSARGFDGFGAVLLCVLLVAFTQLLGGPRPVWAAVAWAVVLAVSGVGFVVHALRHPDPVVAPRLFRNRVFTAAAAGTLLSNVALYGVLLTVPLVLAARSDWSPGASGVVLSAVLGAVAVLTPVGGWLVDHVDRRLLGVGGFLVVGASLLVVAFAGSGLGQAALAGCLAACGLGLGLANPAVQVVSIEAVPPAETGSAGGVLATTRYLGSITCSALLAGPLAAVVHGGGFAVPFTTYAVAGLAGAVAMATLPDRARRHASPAPGATAAGSAPTR